LAEAESKAYIERRLKQRKRHRRGGVEMANRMGNLKTERRGSMGDMEEMLKKKWEATEGKGDGNKGEEEGGFKRSNKTVRSPVEKGGGEDLGRMMREIKREMREGIRGVKEEIREMAREQKEVLREEIEKMKEDLRDREERWNREKKDIQEKIERMEKEIEELKVEGRVRGKEGEEREVKGRKEKESEEEKLEGWKERVKRLERKLERKEKEERRRNIVVKGLKEEEENAEGLEKVWKKLGMEVRVEEVKRVRAGR